MAKGGFKATDRPDCAKRDAKWSQKGADTIKKEARVDCKFRHRKGARSCDKQRIHVRKLFPPKQTKINPNGVLESSKSRRNCTPERSKRHLGAPVCLTCNMMHTKGGANNPADHLFHDFGVAQALTGPKLDAQGTPKSMQNSLKNRCENRCRKIVFKNMKNHRECTRIDAEIYEKSIRLQYPRFLDFCEEYNVKIVFVV